MQSSTGQEVNKMVFEVMYAIYYLLGIISNEINIGNDS
jgi:hypothetical protein